MKAKAILAALSLAIGAAFTPQGMAQTREVDLDRAHLPMPNTTRPRSIVYDAKNPDSKNPPI
ncbi:MAG: hypothetical protein ACK56G_12530, partial [Pirellulaceae bacterium]